METCWKCNSPSSCLYSVRLNRAFKFWWCINCLINAKPKGEEVVEVEVLRIARSCVSASHRRCGWVANPDNEFPYGMIEKRIFHRNIPTHQGE